MENGMCDIRHVTALKAGKHFSHKLYGTDYRVHVCLFKDVKAMRTAMRKFFVKDNKKSIVFSKTVVALTVCRCISGHFYSMVFLAESQSNLSVIAHEVSHVVTFYFTDKRRKFRLGYLRTNENFADKVGDLTQKIFNSVNKLRGTR